MKLCCDLIDDYLSGELDHAIDGSHIDMKLIEPTFELNPKIYRTRYLKRIPNGSETLLNFTKKELKPYLSTFPNSFTPVYEAVKNAFEHGNQLQEDKKIMFSTRRDGSALEVLVGDEGVSGLDKEFFDFIHHVRTAKPGNRKTWYDFAEKDTPPNHAGLGTINIYQGTAESAYCKSDRLDGLMLRMRLSNAGKVW